MNTSCSFIIDLRNSTTIVLYVYQPYEMVLYKFVMPCIILLGLTGNVTFIWTVIRVSSLHTSTFIYLFCLACLDLCTLSGFWINKSTVWQSPLRSGNMPLLQQVSELFMWYCYVTSFGFITLVSLERYLAVCRPLKHRLIRGTKRSIKLCLFVIVLSSGIIASVFGHVYEAPSGGCFIWPSDEKFIDYPRHVASRPTGARDYSLPFFKITYISYVVIHIVIITMNCVLYLKILLTLRERKRNKELQINADLERNMYQMATMVVANGAVFFLCNTTFIAVFSYFAIKSFGMGFLSQYEQFGLERVRETFMILNASVNPLIYFVSNQRFRVALRKSFCK